MGPPIIASSIWLNYKEDQCLLDGKCLTQNVVYQATVSTQSSSETYVGLATNFKERYRNHTASFRHQSKRNETELSKHIWALKDNNKPFNIKWRIIKQCRPYSNVNNKCNFCLFEKFVIICRKNLCSLNKRNELASSCPHRNRYLVKKLFFFLYNNAISCNMPFGFTFVFTSHSNCLKVFISHSNLNFALNCQCLLLIRYCLMSVVTLHSIADL